VNIREEDFVFIQDLCLKNCGIRFEKDKVYLLRDRLTSVALQLQLSSIDELCNVLRKNTFESATQKVIDALTTHESSFFRDDSFFRYLRKTLIPGLIQNHQLEKGRPLRIWSTACANGQEPWSLIFLLSEYPEIREIGVNLLCTDVSRSCLQVTEKAVYAENEIKRGLSEAEQIRYFEPGTDGFSVRPQYRKWMTFAEVNLTDIQSVLKAAGTTPWDLILCRNVLIYFEQSVQNTTVHTLASKVARGGSLAFGSTEGFFTIPGFEQPEDLKYIFRRKVG